MCRNAFRFLFNLWVDVCTKCYAMRAVVVCEKYNCWLSFLLPPSSPSTMSTYVRRELRQFTLSFVLPLRTFDFIFYLSTNVSIRFGKRLVDNLWRHSDGCKITDNLFRLRMFFFGKTVTDMTFNHRSYWLALTNLETTLYW